MQKMLYYFYRESKYCLISFEGGSLYLERSISDTLNFVPIDETAKKLYLSHDRVFHMSHKILAALKKCGRGKLYYLLSEEFGCSVKDINKETDKFFHLNNANGFHSFIKN